MAKHQQGGRGSSGAHWEAQEQKAREQIDEYAERIASPRQREQYLAIVEGVREELRHLGRARDNQHAVIG